MRVKDLLTDDDAVSPVIGVILMVAITVILAAVIAAFVLGLGDTNATAPNTSFNYDYQPTGTPEVAIRVEGGDSFDSDQVSFVGTVVQDGQTWTDVAVNQVTSVTGQTEVNAGASVTLEVDISGTSISKPDNYLLEIKWTSESGDTSSIIGSNTGPQREV
jgi:flagellin-like protein